MVFADVYLQPDAPDPVLDERSVVDVARRYVPDAGPLLAVDETGGEARTYLLGGDVVLKTQRPHRLRPRTSLAKEAFVLGEMHRHGNFPVPLVHGHGHVDGIEYLCLSRLAGSALARTPVATGQRRLALQALGRTLGALHGVEQAALERSELVPGDRHPSDLRARIAAAFERLAAAVGADSVLAAVADVRRIAAERLRATPPAGGVVTLHSNPGPEHVFIDPVTGAFTGLIDFGDAYRSHPAFDFRPWVDEADAVAVLDGYRATGPLPPDFEDVRRTVLVLGALGRAVRGRSTPDELAAELGRLVG